MFVAKRNSVKLPSLAVRSCLCQKLKISLWASVIGLASQVDGPLLRKLRPLSWDVLPASLHPDGAMQRGQKCFTWREGWGMEQFTEKWKSPEPAKWRAGIKSLTTCPVSLLFYSGSLHRMPSDVHHPFLIFCWFGMGRFVEEVLKMRRRSLKCSVNSSSRMLKHQFCFKQPAFWGTVHFTVPDRDVCGDHSLKIMSRNGDPGPVRPSLTCRQLCCRTEENSNTSSAEVCHEKTADTEGGEGRVLILVFSSAIAHLEFKSHIRVLVWQTQKVRQGIYSLNRKGMHKRICFIYGKLVYTFHEEEHFFFPFSHILKEQN